MLGAVFRGKYLEGVHQAYVTGALHLGGSTAELADPDAFAAWVYVAGVALILPQTLSWQLTHLAKWPRTDTFGEVSFVVSFFAFIAYRLTREPARPESR